MLETKEYSHLGGCISAFNWVKWGKGGRYWANMTYNFGIIGLGMIAKFHAATIRATRGANLVAVFSEDESKADKFASEFNCAAYSDFSSFLTHKGLDAVSICTPSSAHLQPCLASAEAGKHIVCEKPLEVSVERIDKMIGDCDK